MEAVRNKTCKSDDDNTDSNMKLYVKRMKYFRESIYADAKDGIIKSLQKQKRDYDAKHRKAKVYA